MLNNKNKLFFPKIIISSYLPTDLHAPLAKIYQLDWKRKQRKCSNEIMELTPEYEMMLDNMYFNIADGYLSEIRRLCWAAVWEYNEYRNINPLMSKVYLMPMISYVETAFNLLSDCLYDKEAGQYYKGPIKHLAPYLLLYKFWKHQVKREILIDCVAIPKLLAIMENNNLSEETLSMINKFSVYLSGDLE